jgi:hypothetical protein
MNIPGLQYLFYPIFKNTFPQNSCHITGAPAHTTVGQRSAAAP